MSGYTDNAIVHQGVLNEDANFIQKPFSPDALARNLAALQGRCEAAARGDETLSVRSSSLAAFVSCTL